MKQTVNQPPQVPSAAPLNFAEVIAMAQLGGIDHAFHNLLGYCAVSMKQAGQAETSRQCMVALAAEKQQAAASARQVMESPSQPRQRLQQWFHLRGYDQQVSNQKLVSRLETLVQQDFPGPFAASQAWLARGFSPQGALVRAVAQADQAADPSTFAAALADWVTTSRARRAELDQLRAGPLTRQAAEANYERRALRDFHLRVVLGLNEPGAVGTLEADDAPLALAIWAIWVDDTDPDQPQDSEILAGLTPWVTRTYPHHQVALDLYERLQSSAHREG